MIICKCICSYTHASHNTHTYSHQVDQQSLYHLSRACLICNNTDIHS